MKPDSDAESRPAPPPDGDAIPLLTERLYVATLPPVLSEEEPAAGSAGPDAAKAPPAADTPAPAEPAAAAPPTATAQTVIDIGLVREALLDDLEGTLPAQIESMIRREVSNAIDDAVFRVVAETQDALARALGQVIERAVKEELARLRNEGG